MQKNTEIENKDGFALYRERLVKSIANIKPGQYVRRITSGFNVRDGYPVPIFKEYKITGIIDGCKDDSERLKFPQRFKTLVLQLLEDSEKPSGRTKIYYWEELLPFCRFEIE